MDNNKVGSFLNHSVTLLIVKKTTAIYFERKHM